MFSLAFQSGSNLMAISTIATGLYIDVNEMFLQVLEYSRDEVIGKTSRELTIFDDYQQRDFKKSSMLENSFAKDIEVKMRTKTGKELIGLFSASTITLGEEQCWLTTMTDITERKHTEAGHSRAQDELENAHQELQQSFTREQALARIDDLTGINNHRSLLQLAEREFDVAMHYRPPLSMMFFDIDHFKQINDTFGHAMGDLVLQKIIDVVCSDLRRADVIGRYGGDEFVILMPHTSAQEALPFAERIHASIAALRLDTDKCPLTLTISIGIAQTIHTTEPGAGSTDTVESLLLRADQAMYTTKQTGRNCTVVFEPGVSMPAGAGVA